MKNKLFFLLSMTLFLVYQGISQKEFKNLDSTPAEWHKFSLMYLKFTSQNFQNKENKTMEDTLWHFRNIAAMYSNLGESADTVFFYIDKMLRINKFFGCRELTAHEQVMKDSDDGMYYGKLDKNRYLNRLIPCQKYMKKFDEAQIKKIKSDTTLDQKMVSLIEIMINNDQKYRFGKYDHEKQYPLDVQNQLLLDSIFTNYGFPGKSRVSLLFASDVCTIFLHTEGDFQEKWLPLLIKSYKQDELSRGDIVLALDRFHTMKFNRQFFGTQRIMVNNKLVNVEKYSDIEQRKILNELNLSELFINKENDFNSK